jgi:hypothetical protein
MIGTISGQQKFARLRRMIWLFSAFLQSAGTRGRASGRQPRACPIGAAIKPRATMAWAKMQDVNRLNAEPQNNKTCGIGNLVIIKRPGDWLARRGAAAVG